MAQYQRQLPASVYWRRRLVVFGGLIAVIAVIVLIIVRPGFGSGSATDAAESAALTDAPTLGNCLPSQIELVPRTDQNTYDSGVSPQLWMGIRNLSAVDCILSVGTDVQRYEIRSGDDLIWSSTDCQQESVPLSVTLMAGSEQETVSIPWDRSRSTPETCEPTTTRPTMPGGGASYHLRVFLGETASAETRQFLLN